MWLVACSSGLLGGESSEDAERAAEVCASSEINSLKNNFDFFFQK